MPFSHFLISMVHVVMAVCVIASPLQRIEVGHRLTRRSRLDCCVTTRRTAGHATTSMIRTRRQAHSHPARNSRVSRPYARRVCRCVSVLPDVGEEFLRNEWQTAGSFVGFVNRTSLKRIENELKKMINPICDTQREGWGACALREAR
jgi:hypothetical protein